MPYAEVNGQRLFYEDTGGDGPAVVLSHGFLMDRTMFEPQVQALADEFRFITYDERGWGDSEYDEKPFTYWDLAVDVIGLVDHLGLQQATLGGMSQGGFISLRAALANPDRVKALVLIDTQAGIEDEANVAAYRGMHDEWVTNGPQDALAGAIASIILGPAPAVRDPWIAKWQELPKEALTQPFECLMGRDDITARLGEITQPAIVFHGTDDAAIPPAKGEELCAGLANCTGVVTVQGGTHASNLTHPDEVNGPLGDFLRKYA